MNDYLLKIKTIGHSLAAIGDPISDKDLLMAILNGLGDDYDNVIGLITYQMGEINIDKVQYLLLMHEQRLLTKTASHVSTVNNFENATMSVNFTSQIVRGGRNSIGFRGGNYKGGNNRGRGRFSSKRFYCQLCGKPGHFADCCYHRFDRTFQRSSNSFGKEGGKSRSDS